MGVGHAASRLLSGADPDALSTTDAAADGGPTARTTAAGAVSSGAEHVPVSSAAAPGAGSERGLRSIRATDHSAAASKRRDQSQASLRKKVLIC